MKKIAILLSVVMSATMLMSACGDKNEPSQSSGVSSSAAQSSSQAGEVSSLFAEGVSAEAVSLYKNMSVAAPENLTSMSCTMEMLMDMEMAGEKVLMNTEMSLKQLMLSETDMQLAMDMKLDMGPQGSANTTIFYKDGYMYQAVEDSKMKYALPLDVALEQANTDQMQINKIDFVDAAVKEADVKDVDGGKQVTILLDGEAMADFASEMMASALATLGQEAKIKFDDILVIAQLNNDNIPVLQSMVFSAEIEVAGEKANVLYDITIKDFEYNTITEINFPADLDQYVEVDLNAMAPAA